MNKFAFLILAGALSAGAAEPPLKVSMLDNDILCIRASQVLDNFAEQVQTDQPTNKISGAILDLRFADGGKTVSDDNLFSSKKFPLVILVNDKTTGGALELAKALRSAGRGIIIGGTNLNGKITPDIAIAVNDAEEKKFQENPYAETADNKANRTAANDLLPFVDHMSEAELVSKRAKDGELDEPNIPRRRTGPAGHPGSGAGAGGGFAQGDGDFAHPPGMTFCNPFNPGQFRDFNCK